MDPLSSALTTAWVLFWLAAVGIVGPGISLGPSAGRSTIVPELGPALVWTWLTMAVGVPLLASVHGFNWVTALLLSGAWPAALWFVRHRGRHESTLRDAVRRLVFRAVSPQTGGAPRIGLGESGSVMLAMPLLSVTALVTGALDLRLPMPADFDTLSHTRQLLDGTAAWDPVASLAAVLVRVSSTDALHVALALRWGLIMLSGAAAALLVAEVYPRASGARIWGRAVMGTAVAIMVVAPHAPAHGWAVVLVALLGATSLVRWIRDEQSRQGWHSLAALLLGVAMLATFSDRLDVLFRVRAAGQYLEHRAAVVEAVRLARSQPDGHWTVVGAPELALAIGPRGGYVDLASFVSRFEHRAHQAGFRFTLTARRLFVFIEKQPVEGRETVRHVRFVDAQPAVYRVRRERMRLQRLARAICDRYRRSHSGVTIIHDDAELRVYRIEL